MVTAQCQLPYPEKFEVAFRFYQAWPQEAKQPSQETQLLLYGLSMQVHHGPCQESKPSSWNAAATAKWHAWSGLDSMDTQEAMYRFVKTLEEDEPDWYSYCAPEDTAQEPNGKSGSGSMGLRSLPCDDVWRSPWVIADKHPNPRFEHACCLIGSTMYLFGGNTAGGRYLSDVWQLNLETLTWTNVTNAFSPVEPPQDAPEDGDEVPAQPAAADPGAVFPPCAAAIAVPHRGRALLIGGHTKAQKANPTAPLVIRVLDPARQTWGVLPCTGAVPTWRGGHTAAIIGDKVYLFGGEGARLRLQQGVKMLDLMTNEWSDLEWPKVAPEARSALVATAYQDRYLLLFGGGAVGKCHNDLWVLDTETNTWEQPAVTGPRPSPRAGCCGALLGNRWFILGGGNNAAGCPDMWMLDLVALGVGALEWQPVAQFDVRAPLSSEGASLVAAPAYGALVAFGGYNGVFHNAVSAFKPADRVEPVSPVPLLNGEIPEDRTPEIQPADAPAPQEPVPREAETDPPAEVPQAKLQVQKSTAALLEEVSMAKEALQQELELTQNTLSTAQAEQAKSVALVKAIQAELETEKDRAFKLEVEMSELRTKLQGMQELEMECRKYKQMLAERDRKSAGGIWGYISGA